MPILFLSLIVFLVSTGHGIEVAKEPALTPAPPVTRPPTTAPPTTTPPPELISQLSHAEVIDTYQLTFEETDEYQPHWSPDGDRIVYQSTQSGNPDIWIMEEWAGGAQTQLTQDETWQYDPEWSPDGAKIVYVSEETGNPDIWVMKVDGSGKKR
ncbi:MAG: DPP IV N-terminal domain-containing protein, partial [Candidatus Thermoplasmatota archaeon]|nr:DPP IV N-terminal domain-containing protein [Candidatus Thermoplasmatota archaeon]